MLFLSHFLTGSQLKFRAGKSVERLHEAGEYAAVPFSFSKLNFLPFARSFIEEKCQRTGLREMNILQLHLVEQKIWSTDLWNCRDPVSKKVYPFDSTNLNICFDALILVSFFLLRMESWLLCNGIISRARKIVSVDWLLGAVHILRNTG